MDNLLISRRSKTDRMKFYRASIYKKIRKYIREGCKGDLDLHGTPIEYLPKELKYVGGELDISDSPINRLPDGLEIKGSLWTSQCPFEEYPINVKVGRSVDIRSIKISKLPDNLIVYGDLYIWGTQISEIPNNLNIKGNLYCSTTPLYREYAKEEIKQMIIDKGGSIKYVF